MTEKWIKRVCVNKKPREKTSDFVNVLKVTLLSGGTKEIQDSEMFSIENERFIVKLYGFC